MKTCEECILFQLEQAREQIRDMSEEITHQSKIIIDDGELFNVLDKYMYIHDGFIGMDTVKAERNPEDYRILKKVIFMMGDDE